MKSLFSLSQRPSNASPTSPRGSGHDSSSPNHSHLPHILQHSETSAIRHRNSAKLDSLIHQYHLRDSESGDGPNVAAAYNLSLIGSRRWFHMLLTFIAVYVGVVVPWTGAFKDADNMPLLLTTICVRWLRRHGSQSRKQPA